MRARRSEDEKSHRTGLPRSTERLLPAPHCVRAGAPQNLASDTMPVRQRWLSISVGRLHDEAATCGGQPVAVSKSMVKFFRLLGSLPGSADRHFDLSRSPRSSDCPRWRLLLPKAVHRRHRGPEISDLANFLISSRNSKLGRDQSQRSWRRPGTASGRDLFARGGGEHRARVGERL